MYLRPLSHVKVIHATGLQHYAKDIMLGHSMSSRGTDIYTPWVTKQHTRETHPTAPYPSIVTPQSLKNNVNSGEV